MDNQNEPPMPEAIKASALQLLQQYPSAMQIIVVLTSSGNQYHMAIDDIPQNRVISENAITELLLQNQDTQVQYLVCMWSNGSIDVPSWHLQELLSSIDPKNSHAQILVNTFHGLHTKSLHSLQPK